MVRAAARDEWFGGGYAHGDGVRVRELGRHALRPRPAGPAVLCNRTLVWRGERALTVLDGGSARVIAADWDLEHHELTPDGRYLLARGDDGRRVGVWDVRSGHRILDVPGDGARRRSLRASVGAIAGEPHAFVASRARPRALTLVRLRDGEPRGWLSTSGMVGFGVERVIPLAGDWLAVHGHGDAEPFDTVVAIPAGAVLDDVEALQAALREHPSVKEWGYHLAIGPAGPGCAVVYRDAEWSYDDDRPENPDEAFRGLAIRDLAAGRVLQRFSYDGPVSNLATIGADAAAIAIAGDGYVDVVARDGGAVRRIAAFALDPHRLEVARLDGDEIVIAALGG
jgi:hypothetical protein